MDVKTSAKGYQDGHTTGGCRSEAKETKLLQDRKRSCLPVDSFSDELAQLADMWVLHHGEL